MTITLLSYVANKEMMWQILNILKFVNDVARYLKKNLKKNPKKLHGLERPSTQIINPKTIILCTKSQTHTHALTFLNLWCHNKLLCHPKQPAKPQPLTTPLMLHVWHHPHTPIQDAPMKLHDSF